MINIQVWCNSWVEIEGKEYYPETTDSDLLRLIKDILDKVHYSGETICLESVEIRDGKNYYTELGRWK